MKGKVTSIAYAILDNFYMMNYNRILRLTGT